MAMTTLERLAARRRQAGPRIVKRLRQRDGLIQQAVEAVAGPRVRIGGRWVLIFAATNYLGLNRDPQILQAIANAAQRWGTSLGTPRLFATDRLTARLETVLARLVGHERALVFPSTTHIALDLLPLLAGPKGMLFVDERAYPISLEGVYAAASRGAQIRYFPHNNYQALYRMLKAYTHIPDKVIVCDGVYPAEGRAAPLREITHAARKVDAVVYVDDAHGIGVLGERPTRNVPYGRGGGGTPRHLNVTPGNIVHVGSLSKAFGVPVAFVAGPTGFVDYLRATASTFTHSSPPAIPMLGAAQAALRLNTAHGDALRRRLLQRVSRFRRGLAQSGVRLASNRLFPIQTIRFASPRMGEAAGRELRRNGIWAVLQFRPPDYPKGAVLRFVLTARHHDADIDEASAKISHTLSRLESPYFVSNWGMPIPK
jgi:8-amino-7-oxononanoate synthase